MRRLEEVWEGARGKRAEEIRHMGETIGRKGIGEFRPIRN
jgi:hypothetical protein